MFDVRRSCWKKKKKPVRSYERVIIQEKKRPNARLSHDTVATYTRGDRHDPQSVEIASALLFADFFFSSTPSTVFVSNRKNFLRAVHPSRNFKNLCCCCYRLASLKNVRLTMAFGVQNSADFAGTEFFCTRKSCCHHPVRANNDETFYYNVRTCVRTDRCDEEQQFNTAVIEIIDSDDRFAFTIIYLRIPSANNTPLRTLNYTVSFGLKIHYMRLRNNTAYCRIVTQREKKKNDTFYIRAISWLCTMVTLRRTREMKEKNKKNYKTEVNTFRQRYCVVMGAQTKKSNLSIPSAVRNVSYLFFKRSSTLVVDTSRRKMFIHFLDGHDKTDVFAFRVLSSVLPRLEKVCGFLNIGTHCCFCCQYLKIIF